MNPTTTLDHRCFQLRMATDSRRIPVQGKGADPPERRAGPPPPRAALGPGRKELCLHRPTGQVDPGQFVRWPEPTGRLSLHVRARLGRGLPGLLLRDGSHERRGRASGRARRLAGARLPRPAREDSRHFRSGWAGTSRWVSSGGSDFNRDFGVAFTKQEVDSGKKAYNFGTIPPHGEENPGLSCFYKDPSGAIFHTYSAYARGLEAMLGTYAVLDRAPKGRDEEGLPMPMAWVRHHDRYEPTMQQAGSCCHEKQCH